MMPPPDSKQAEKDYLRRAAAGDWERFKPFSPPATYTLDDSVPLIRDFAAALAILRPSASDLVLDLGAGGCWCSDWLARLNLRTVSVDIAHDMLRVGQARVPESARGRLAAGDMERLPFASGAFDKAICLSALHHVPSIETALGEIARVLTPQGMALFSEPGQGHASKPEALVAMRDFGVLEQDIVVDEFLGACRRAGFADVSLKPMSYLLPEVELTPEQWRAWSRLAARRRPLRAAEKLGRAVLELFGLGKRDVLFEDAFAMTVVRTLRAAMNDHPVVLASKQPRAAVSGAELAATIAALKAPATARAGEPIDLEVRVTNVGRAMWRARPSTALPGHVQLGVQLLAGDRRLIDRDYHRAALPADMAPGSSSALRVSCLAPATRGSYALKLDLVMEGVTWFEPRGSATVVIGIDLK